AELFQMFDGVGEGKDISRLIFTVMSLDYSSLFEISESDNQLEILVHGTELLQEFGLEFGLGDVTINISGGTVYLGAIGANIEVASGRKIDQSSSDYQKYFGATEVYKNISALVLQLPSVLKNGTLFLRGNIDLAVGDTVVSVAVRNGAVTWKNGFSLYLDLLLDLSGTLQEIQLSVTANYLEFAYGQVGARVYFSEFKTLDEAFVALYHRIKTVADQAFDSASPLPANVESILDLLKLVVSQQGTGEQSVSLLKIEDILNGITILPPASENGLCVIAYHGISLELFNSTQDSMIGVGVACTQEKISIEGSLTLSVSEMEFPKMPEITYLETADFVELLDYVGAAVEAFAQQDITISIAGKTVSSADSSVVCDVTGRVVYHEGERFTIHIDKEKHNFYLNTD
ncbi:MAG: hypothetical protein K2H43_02660, partial [Clostridia bacterium]|nr:hypothetical protein [Clostridia bacterium]